MRRLYAGRDDVLSTIEPRNVLGIRMFKLMMVATTAMALACSCGSAEPPTEKAVPTDGIVPSLEQYSGKGSTVLRISPTKGLTTVELTSTGLGKFEVWKQGASTQLLADGLGPYSGTAVLSPERGEFALNIRSDGAWTATLRRSRQEDAESKAGSFYCGRDGTWPARDVAADAAIAAASEVPGAGGELISSGAEQIAQGEAQSAERFFRAESEWRRKIGLKTRDLEPSGKEADLRLSALELSSIDLLRLAIRMGIASYTCVTSAVIPKVQLDETSVISVKFAGPGLFAVRLIDGNGNDVPSTGLPRPGFPLVSNASPKFGPVERTVVLPQMHGTYALAVIGVGIWEVNVGLAKHE